MNPVLLIDDDGKLAEVLSEYCAKFGIRIEPALLPSTGLEKLHKDNYDAVILDVMLPEMDGFEVCKKIRQFTDIPIIMLTARGEVTDRIVGLELGADDYLPKPFSPRRPTCTPRSLLLGASWCWFSNRECSSLPGARLG